MQTLTEYKVNLVCNPVAETCIFSEEECSIISHTLIKLKDKWKSRTNNYFMSLGALSYIDECEDYINTLKYFNPILWDNFKWVYEKIQFYYSERINKPIEYWPYSRALPGFHIFQDAEFINKNKWAASIHTDSPHLKHTWPNTIQSIFTFTISIQSPKEGSGLRFWTDTASFNNKSPIYYEYCSDDVKRKLKEEAIYIPYKIGYIYEHTGDLYHQIATEGSFSFDEKRISLQGHLIELDKAIILYV